MKKHAMNWRTFSWTMVAAVAAVGLTWFATTETRGQGAPPFGGAEAAEQPAQAERAEGDLAVGVYQPQAAFSHYPGRETFMERMQTLQGEAQQAQQQGDQQAFMQAQQQLQAEQQEFVQEFHQKVEQLMPEVAETTGVDLVVTEVVYKSGQVHETDVTPALVEKLQDEQPQEQQGEPERQAPQVPGFGGGENSR